MGGPTVRLTGDDVIPPKLAVIVVETFAVWLDANPMGLTVMEGFVEFQLTILLKFTVPFVNVPVATYCCAVPNGISALAGVTTRVSNVGGATLRTAEAGGAPLKLAVIVVEPCAIPRAKPVLPIVATEMEDEVQVTWLVRS